MLHSPPYICSSSASTTLLLPRVSLIRNSPSFRSSRRVTALSVHLPTAPGLWLAQALDSGLPNDGPEELPFSFSSFIATDDNPSTLQAATSVLLTGAISIFLFRALRRRAKRARELKFRSTGAKKTLKEEAIESLKAMTPMSVQENATPSPVQAFLGGLAAGAIALILYKFTTTIEASLNRQTISDNYSVRQITITIRTIINGLCYLATFVFGVNSLGLILYSGQLAINSIMGESAADKIRNKDDAQLNSNNFTTSDAPETNINDGDQNSESTP